MRPAKTQISLAIGPVLSESSLCAQWVAKDLSFLHADSEAWSDWVDGPFCWFCHAAAQMTFSSDGVHSSVQRIYYSFFEILDKCVTTWTLRWCFSLKDFPDFTMWFFSSMDDLVSDQHWGAIKNFLAVVAGVTPWSRHSTCIWKILKSVKITFKCALCFHSISH